MKVDSIVRLDSPNYLLVYLNLQGAKAGQMTLNFDGKKVRYTLKNRAMRGEEHKGFSNADVLYLLMPDRFANGNPKNDVVKGMRDQTCDRTKPSLRHGGDLAGIEQHLDYFTDLGVTALWFTPILENNWPNDHGVNSSYHGYATTDYYKVDPRFGTNAEYKQLIDECHKRGLKVVMDMIFNHCSDYHPWNLDPPTKDWFNNPNYGLQTSYKLTPVLDPYASKQDMRETVDGWFVKSMPDLNQRNPHLMRYLIQNSEWWIESAGIDGIRMDTYPYADRKAMAEWMKTLDTEYPNFNTVGETWVTEPAYTAAWQKDSKLSNMNSYLKTVMDFSFFDKLSQAKHEETDDWWKGLNRIYNSLCYDYLYAETGTRPAADDESHPTTLLRYRGADERNQGGHRRQCTTRLPRRFPRRHAQLLHRPRPHQGRERHVPVGEQTAPLASGQRPHQQGKADTVHPLQRHLRHRTPVSGPHVADHPQRQAKRGHHVRSPLC